MKRITRILRLVALVFFVTASLKAGEWSASANPKQSSQDESLKAQGQNKSSKQLEIKFEGLQNFSESDLLNELRAQRAGISKENLIDPDKVEGFLSAVKGYLSAHGYRHASVTTRRDKGSAADKKALTFIVNEGERARINEIRFEDNEKI